MLSLTLFSFFLFSFVFFFPKEMKRQQDIVQQNSEREVKEVFGLFNVPRWMLVVIGVVTQACILVLAIWNAFRIRTYALTEYGYVIHEFDPWFNFRATQYLQKHGWEAFFTWFDYMSWYPLGRPVGTTIYPGLQITSVVIYRVLRWLGKPWRMTLNDVCCTVPCWGGAAATFFLALITYELTGSRNAAVVSALIMAIIPAHMMRSVGGGYDNESIAMTAMLMTFYFWIRSLRTCAYAYGDPRTPPQKKQLTSWWWGILAGLAYGYMVAAWGGFVFVLNMVAIHAAFLMIYEMWHNRYNKTLFWSYMCFFPIGTYIATCVPPVATAPFKSLEQILALLVFIFFIAIHLSERERERRGVEIMSKEGIRIRVRYCAATMGILLTCAMLLAPSGFFGPISSRVRGLFLKHTRTGNPLVDSVAEHQPATNEAYWHYLHICCYGWQIGTFAILPLFRKRLGAASFMSLYSVVAYYFSLKMARLIILAGPVAAVLSGAIAGWIIDWILDQFWWSEAEYEEGKLAKENKTKDGKIAVRPGDESIEATIKRLKLFYKGARSTRVAFAIALIGIIMVQPLTEAFVMHSERMAHSFANPQLMFKSRLQDGTEVMIDDYREAYHWLRDTTPEDSRVMAWWDYGYQITGIGNRTSIADGNTWNHEHIATLGKCLTSPVPEAHSLIRHLADYVLVWAGGYGDDLAKSPHMARIGNSVYRDICPEDPLCSKFGFYDQQHEKPTPMMRKSLLYNLHAHNLRKGVRVDPKYFKEAYNSKHGLVRIFEVVDVDQDSKAWGADPANRKCDAPGSWYCVGQYPPAKEIQELLAKRRDFGQLEDFNKKNHDEDYHKAYMQRFGGQ